jgi:hypothetical protein
MSAAAPTAKALADAKVKRQKQILAVGSVILLALLGYQLPKLLGGSSAAPTPTTTAGTVAVPPASPTAVAPGKLPDTDRVSIEPQSGQLLSFGLFKSKDPFVQQLSTLASALPSAPTTPAPAATAPFVTPTVSQPSTPPRRTAPNGGLTPATTTSPAATVPFPSTTPVTPAIPAPTSTSTSTPTPAPTAPPPATATPTPTKPAAPAAGPAAVAISTNGVCESIPLNGKFPGSEDIFRVVSIDKDGKSVKIAVVGGAYDSGQAAATLKLGEKLTLVNTADGTRYVLLLKTHCDTETAPATETTTTTATSTTTTTSTVAPPAPTNAVVTPIVTDPLDTTTPGG